ncbi:hypothetical protein, partial [Salmonella enterica]|uniref:hypothetical protein n=1 Tax=Salmonella enterica TaxID=28901 RepID=UPI0015CC7107
RLSYVSTDNVSGTATATLGFPREGLRVEKSVRLRDCARGCLVTGLEVSRDLTGVYTIDPFNVKVGSISIGDTDLARRTWLP